MSKKVEAPAYTYVPIEIPLGTAVILHPGHRNEYAGTVVATAKSAAFPGSDIYAQVETCGLFGKKQRWELVSDLYTVKY